MLFYEQYLTTTGPDSNLNYTANDIFTLLCTNGFFLPDGNNKLGKVHCIHQWANTGHRLLFPNKIVFLSLKTVFVLANSVDPDEMPHSTLRHFIWVFTVCDSVTAHI